MKMITLDTGRFPQLHPTWGYEQSLSWVVVNVGGAVVNVEDRDDSATSSIR
jgi:hypothetical protein